MPLLVIAAAPLAGLALAALAPTGWWIAGLARHWAPQLVVLSLPLWCWHGRRPAIGLTMLLIAAAALWPTLLAAYATTAPAPTGATIHVTTANIYEKSPLHREAIARLDGELVALIETHSEDRARLAHDPRWPHQRWQDAPGTGGMALLSAFPMHAKDLDLKQAYGFDARVDAPWGRIRVLVLHTWSPRNAHNSLTNRRQLAELTGLVATEPGPLLVLGDFNASPADPAMFELRQAGLCMPLGGEVRTWPAQLGPFGIAIDHVLARGLGLGKATAIDLPGSDHHAVQVRVGGGIAAPQRQDATRAPTETSPP